MAKPGSTAVARTAISPVAPAAIAIEAARLARLIVAGRLVFVLGLRLRILLGGFGRRRHVERIVPRFMRSVVRMIGRRCGRRIAAVAKPRNRFTGQHR